MIVEPFLKWAGGKRKLASTIIERIGMENATTYVEPFLGGGAVLFEIRSRFPNVRCFASDVNEEIMNLFMVVRDEPRQLIDELQKPAYRYDEKLYYAMRASSPDGLVPMAARTLYLNKTGYNGMYRVNKKGGFNIPFGDYKNPSIYTVDNIMAASKALRGVVLGMGSYESVRYPDGARVYMDPPYLPTSKTADFTAYTKGDFGPKDHHALADFAERLVLKGHRVVVSNSDMPLIREVYPKNVFSIEEIQAARNLSCKGEGRKKVSELLIVGAQR